MPTAKKKISATIKQQLRTFIIFSEVLTLLFRFFVLFSHATLELSSIVCIMHQTFGQFSFETSALLRKLQPNEAFISLYERPTCRHLCNHIYIIRCGSNVEITRPMHTAIQTCIYILYIQTHTHIYAYKSFSKSVVALECK